MTQPVPWGATTLILDNEAFCRVFLVARQWYCEDIYGQDGRPPEEPQRAYHLSGEEVLRLVVMPDEPGRYHFDEMGDENLPEYLGNLGGPLAPQGAAHETEPLPMTVFQEG